MVSCGCVPSQGGTSISAVSLQSAIRVSDRVRALIAPIYTHFRVSSSHVMQERYFCCTPEWYIERCKLIRFLDRGKAIQTVLQSSEVSIESVSREFSSITVLLLQRRWQVAQLCPYALWLVSNFLFGNFLCPRSGIVSLVHEILPIMLPVVELVVNFLN
jgi:hypothetical protein